MQIYRDHPVRVNPYLDDVIAMCIPFFDSWLESLDIDQSDAILWFMIDYGAAYSPYHDSIIVSKSKSVATANAKKYDKLVAIYNATYNPLENYNRTEESTHTRTPDLTKTETHDTETGVENSSSTDSTINQTRTTTNTPTAYTTTTTRSVAPFDTATLQNKEQDTSVLSGSTATTDTYTGDPDHTETSGGSTTTVTGDITTTETGTDTTEIESTIHGNIGVLSTQAMAEQEIALAEKMAIWKVIEKDLAAAILLQVW